MSPIGKAFAWGIVIEGVAALIGLIGFVSIVMTNGHPLARAVWYLAYALHMPSVLLFEREAVVWSAAIQPLIWIGILYFWFRVRDRAKQNA